MRKTFISSALAAFAATATLSTAAAKADEFPGEKTAVLRIPDAETVSLKAATLNGTPALLGEVADKNTGDRTEFHHYCAGNQYDFAAVADIVGPLVPHATEAERSALEQFIKKHTDDICDVVYDPHANRPAATNG